MSSNQQNNDISISVRNLGKMYRIYDQPSDRLKQMFLSQIRNRSYGREFWALRNFSCDVHKGQMLGVIGRNGSGKSTLLQMLAGTLPHTEGSIYFKGRISALLELGSGFNPEYSGRDNVFLYGAILGIDAAEMRKRFDSIADFAGIGDFMEQPVKTYSSGMGVRLAFAVASSIDPEILIVDEALAVGDMVFQQKCFQRFKKIREHGATVIFVTHDLGSIVQYCDQAIVLAKGHMIAEGSPKNMIDHYKKTLADELLEPDIIAPTPIKQAATPAGRLQDGFQKNPNCQEYGDGAADIADWGVLDDSGAKVTVISGGQMATVVMRVKFHRRCADPIAAFTIRDLKGNELIGSNTFFEQKPIGLAEPGDEALVSFRMELPLQPGGYALCLGCTEFTDNGLAVHHRLYDVILIECVTPRRFVGLYDVKPEIQIIRSTT